MGVNIGGGGEVAVTQPFLNLLHGNAVCQKKAGAAVAQIVEADRTQTVFLQQLRELLGNVVGTDDVPDLVHTQIAEIIPIVAFTAQAAVGVLLTFQHQQTVTDGRHKGQRPQTGFRFCAVCLHQNLFAVDGCLRDDVLDLQRVGFKVDGIPFQTQHLAAAQAVEGCQQNRDLQFGALCDLRQSIQELNSFSSLALQTFQDELFPQLIELYQTNPAQLKAVLGDQIIPLDRAILGWTEAQEKLRLKEEVEQLGGPDDLYRENCLYEHFMWEYEQNPNAKYYGQFGGAHVLLSNYSGKVYRVQNSFVTRLSSLASPLHEALTVIDGVLSLEVGALGNSTTNNAILYNTVLANPPIEKSNKFYSDSPDISDTNFAQYVLLFEDPAKLTVTKERSGAYWKYH